MATNSERLTGVVITVYPSASRYGGSYGEIAGDDGKHYVYASSHVFRNCSHATLGAKLSFEVLSYDYVTNIDQIDKPAPRLTTHNP